MASIPRKWAVMPDNVIIQATNLEVGRSHMVPDSGYMMHTGSHVAIIGSEEGSSSHKNAR